MYENCFTQYPDGPIFLITKVKHHCSKMVYLNCFSNPVKKTNIFCRGTAAKVN